MQKWSLEVLCENTSYLYTCCISTSHSLQSATITPVTACHSFQHIKSIMDYLSALFARPTASNSRRLDTFPEELLLHTFGLSQYIRPMYRTPRLHQVQPNRVRVLFSQHRIDDILRPRLRSPASPLNSSSLAPLVRAVHIGAPLVPGIVSVLSPPMISD